ncbi:MAG: hypothetical protein HDT47_01015 [Ruminococcaceae bacterium]|nr:hypothetical protein [Oscillospiraceae bacterium]
MKAKIKTEINWGETPVWLSPTVNGERLKMLQNFFLTLEVIPDHDETSCGFNTSLMGPGEIPCVILRGFSKIVSKGEFETAEFSYSDDNDWECKWANDSDLEFSYSGEAPFENIDDKCTFAWRNFYTLAEPENKKVTLSVEAYYISGCTDGVQGSMSASFAYPAYIISFQPDEALSEGIVYNDSENRRCVVSKGGTAVLRWNGAADRTYQAVMKKNGVEVTGSFLINGSYSVKNITENSDYELTVINDYRFPHSLTYRIDMTDWQKKNEEKGLFQGDIYGSIDCNSQIFVCGSTWYAYCHPNLYKKDENGEWKSVSENTLYKDCDYSHYASYLYGTTLYCAGSVKDSSLFCFCRYDITSGKWNKDNGYVALPHKEDDVPMCCGFAVSSCHEYFYFAEKGVVSVWSYSSYALGWASGSFYINAPNDTKLIGCAMLFRIDRFYMAMLCKENGESGNKNVYLFDCLEGTEECLRKYSVSKDTARITMLKTANSLWIATDREIINCEKTACDDLFYPSASESGKAWFGADENNIFGIFPDKHLWVYDYTNIFLN